MLFQRAVEEALDMDIMPFAVPLRMKSAWGFGVNTIPHRLVVREGGGCGITNLFDTVHERVMNIEQRPIAQRKMPW